MATENRGGTRYPKKPAAVSGVGKNSKRTDSQRIKAPNVQDSTELTVGDREKIEAGQRLRPLARSPEPRVEAPAVSPSLGPSGTALPPEHLMGIPSTRPDEDLMAQAPGQADPDDDKEFVLQMLASAPWGNEGVRRMLDDLRTERAQKTVPPPVQRQPLPPAEDVSPVPGEPEIEPVELGATEEAAIPEEDPDFI